MTNFLCASPRDLRPRKSRKGQLTKRFIYYSLYAWGVPLVIVLIGQILERKKTPDSTFVTPGFGTFKCWFSGEFRRQLKIGQTSIFC